MRRHGPPRQHEPRRDLRVGQPFLDKCRNLELGVGQRVPSADRSPVLAVRAAADAVGPELGVDPVEVRFGPEELVNLHGLLEGVARSGAVFSLDKALGGILKPQLESHTGGMTYRQQTARLMSQQAWLMLILDLGLGPYADQPLNAWQEAFLPMELQHAVSHVTVKNADGHAQPLVIDEQVVSPNRLDAPPATAPDLRLPLALAGLVFAVLDRKSVV